MDFRRKSRESVDALFKDLEVFNCIPAPAFARCNTEDTRWIRQCTFQCNLAFQLIQRNQLRMVSDQFLACFIWTQCHFRQSRFSEQSALIFLRILFFIEVVHFLTKVADTDTSVTVLISTIQIRDNSADRSIFCNKFFESLELCHQRIQLGFGFGRCHQEQDRVEVILFRNDPVVSQIVCKDSCRDTEIFVLACFYIDARCSQHQFVRINKILFRSVAFK